MDYILQLQAANVHVLDSMKSILARIDLYFRAFWIQEVGSWTEAEENGLSIRNDRSQLFKSSQDADLSNPFSSFLDSSRSLEYFICCHRFKVVKDKSISIKCTLNERHPPICLLISSFVYDKVYFSSSVPTARHSCSSGPNNRLQMNHQRTFLIHQENPQVLHPTSALFSKLHIEIPH